MATETNVVRSLRELDALVAENLMGWHKVECLDGFVLSPDDCTPFRLTVAQIHKLRLVQKLPAYTTWAGVEAVVKNREQAGFHWLVKSPFEDGEPYWAGLTPKGVSGWNGKPDFYCSGQTEPIARCLAALASAGVGGRFELGDTPI